MKTISKIVSALIVSAALNAHANDFVKDYACGAMTQGKFLTLGTLQVRGYGISKLDGQIDGKKVLVTLQLIEHERGYASLNAQTTISSQGEMLSSASNGANFPMEDYVEHPDLVLPEFGATSDRGTPDEFVVRCSAK